MQTKNTYRRIPSRWPLFLLASLALIFSACALPAPMAPFVDVEAPPAPRELTVMSHGSFNISEEVVQRFEQEHNAEVKFLAAGDTGTALNQAILSKDDPLADVFFGVDNSFLGRALAEKIFEPYCSPMLDQVRPDLILDAECRALPVDYGYVNLNYDRAWFEEQGLPLPERLEDLTDPTYEGLLVVQNPATSSPGLAWLIATVAYFGAEGDYTYLDFWRDLRANDVLVTEGWSEAYYGQFSAASDGTRPIVVSYATSPAAEVYFADAELDVSPTGNLLLESASFLQVEFVGILQGTELRDLAEAFVEYMLSKPFQEDIPLHMWVYPANQEAELPDVFKEYAQVPDAPTQLTPEEIDAGREHWIQAWTEVVLR